jgi:CheY-like chemotaxis protein
MSEKKKILICDDEEGIRESFKLILNETYNLIFATDGLQALEILNKQQDIQLVLIDIKMPKVNGIEITKEIKLLSPHIKVIVVTGYESAEIAQEALAAGAEAYITKPFETNTVIKKINDCF